MSTFVVGLTGGIGSGKSAVGDMLRELGAAVVDTDAIAHELTGPEGAAMAAIRAEFGDSVIAPDGSLDRAAMRRFVFSDAMARKRLEAVLHPLIRAEAQRRCAAATEPYAVLAVPLLVEAGSAYRATLARIAGVDCSEETQIARVTARSGIPREEVLKIMAAQSTRTARRAAADDIIDNEGDLTHLRAQVENLHRAYLMRVSMSSES